VGNDSESPHELWTETLGAFGRDHRLCKLCSCPCGKATWGHAVCSKDYGCCNPFLGPHKIYIKIYSQRRLEK